MLSFCFLLPSITFLNRKRLLAGLKFTQLSFSALVNLSVYLLEASNWERAIEVMEEGNE